MANTPIVNAGLLYVNGLGISKTSAKVVALAAGAARDSLNVNDITLGTAVAITGTTVGANGVDVAAIVLSSFYAVYVIGDSTGYKATAGLLSLSATAPTLPAGYDMFRRVGWILTDGSANILQFYQMGSGQNRTYYYDVGISELSGGSDTSFTAIDLATSVPPISTQVILNLLFTPDGATEVAEFLPFGSSASNGIVVFGCGVAGAQAGNVTVPCVVGSGVPKILYKVASGDTLTASTVGYVDILS